MVTSSQPATLKKKTARRQKTSWLKNTLRISKINPLKQLLWVHLTQRIIIIIIIIYFKRPLLKSLIQVSCKSHVKITKKTGSETLPLSKFSHNSPALPKVNHREITRRTGFQPRTAMAPLAQHGQLRCSRHKADEANCGRRFFFDGA